MRVPASPDPFSRLPRGIQAHIVLLEGRTDTPIPGDTQWIEAKGAFIRTPDAQLAEQQISIYRVETAGLRDQWPRRQSWHAVNFCPRFEA